MLQMAIKTKPDSSWNCQRGCVRHQVILGLVIFALLPAMVQSRIAHSQHHLVVQEGENMVFDQCPSPPDSDGHWGYKRSLEIKDYSECWGKCSTCSSRVLIISDVIRSCGGYYQYNTSPDSNGTRWRCDLQLDVYYPPSPIRIDNPQPNVFEGDDVTMTCSTDDVGNPPGNFTGRQFPKTAGTQNSTSLRLQATRERDGEVIVCEFQYRRFNQTRSNTTTTMLTVFYLPENVSVKERDSVTTFNVGDNIILQCIVGNSNPNSTISWWKDDVIIPGETYTTFVINSVGLQDSGKYKCKASIEALGQRKSKESNEVYISVTSPVLFMHFLRIQL
ncbi:CD166 antigen-like [Branchiostoma floridae x Branchiostoma japonicum]